MLEIGIIILLLSAGCSHQGDINPRNLLLDSRYKTPPIVGLDWLNKNGNDGLAENKYQDLFPEKTTFVVYPKKKSKGRALGGLKDRVNSHDRESLKTALPYLQIIIHKRLKPLLQPFR